jgi:hypothetical protein
MRTKDEMRVFSQALAEEHFYADVDVGTPWEPFEHWSEGQLEEEVENLAISVYMAMLWVQEGTLT